MTDAAAKGIPDAELSGPEGRIQSLDEILSVTTKPIIHANQLLRSSYKSMKEAAETLLLNDRGLGVEAICAPLSEIFHAVGFYDLRDRDELVNRLRILSVIIPAAGRDKGFPDHPKSLIQIAGQSILDHQMQVLRRPDSRSLSW